MDNTKNKAQDLINIMFMQLERMDNDDLTLDEVRKEMIRAKAMCEVVDSITDFTRLQFEVAKAYSDDEISAKGIPRIMET